MHMKKFWKCKQYFHVQTHLKLTISFTFRIKEEQKSSSDFPAETCADFVENDPQLMEDPLTEITIKKEEIVDIAAVYFKPDISADIALEEDLPRYIFLLNINYY